MLEILFVIVLLYISKWAFNFGVSCLKSAYSILMGNTTFRIEKVVKDSKPETASSEESK